MSIRILFVGVVASLGLALPSGESLDSWSRSGLAWVDARLVAWETNRPVDDAAFVFLDEVAPAVTKPEPETETESEPAADDAGLVDALDWELEFELIRLAEVERAPEPKPDAIELGEFGLAFEEFESTIVEMEVDAPRPEVAATEPKPTAEVDRADDDAVAWSDEWVLIFPAWDGAAESDATEIAATEPKPTVERADDAWLDELLAEVSAWEAEAEAAVQPVAIATTESADQVFDRVVEEMATAFARDLTPAPTWAPMEVADDLYSGVAFALNHDAEGLSAPAVKAPKPTPPTPTPTAGEANRLIHALRLTRDAVSAWATVLQGPALASISD